MSQGAIINDPPSPFVVEWLPLVIRALEESSSAGARPDRCWALDVAAGRGRHTALLARAGFRTFAVDVNPDRVREALARARGEPGPVHGWCTDLTKTPLPAARFDLLLITRYLQRDLFPAIRQAVRGGGVVLYETFTTHQRQLGFGPTASDHLLEPGELARRFAGFDVMFSEETRSPEAVARIVARRPET